MMVLMDKLISIHNHVQRKNKQSSAQLVGHNEQSRTLVLNMIHEVPAELRKDGRDQRLSASLKEQRSLLLLVQHGPLSYPIRCPKNYLHRCIMFSFVKYHIVFIQPN